MPRIFASLAVAQIILLAGTGASGMYAERFGIGRHIALAVFTLILACLIQVLTFTYLTVTGKLLVQAVHLGHLPMNTIERAKRLKRSWTFLLAIIVMLVVVVTASGSQLFFKHESLTLHISSAIALVVAHIIVFYLEYDVIFRNAALVARTLDEYSKPDRKGGKETDSASSASV